VSTPPQYQLDDPAIAERYVRHGLERLGFPSEHAQVHYVDAGIMNYVYRAEVPERTFYLKQALPRVKQHDRLGPDLAGVSPARIGAEYRALILVAEDPHVPLWGIVPRPVWYDDLNNVLWTDEILPGAVSLQSELQAGLFDPQLANIAGHLIAAIHAASLGAVPPLWPSADEDHANWRRFLRMRTTGVLRQSDLPVSAQEATHQLAREAQEHERSGMLSHLDLAPKNVLVSRTAEINPIGILDFELGAAVSDPAYDLGFLVGHLLLMGANLPAMAAEAQGAAYMVVVGYQMITPLEIDDDWDDRVNRYAGLTMLYRLYGSSPAPYLDPTRYAAIREQGLRLLLREARVTSP